METLYDILKVREDAPPEIIKAAYKAMSSMFHPDKNPGDEVAAEIMKKVNAAYRVLREPETRARYDDLLRRTQTRNTDRHAQEDSEQGQPQQPEEKSQSEDKKQENSSTTATPKRNSGIGALWRGDKGLAKTYWIYHFIFGGLLGFLFSIAAKKGITPQLQLVAAVLLTYSVVVAVGVWRAANKYQGPSILAILAKCSASLPFVSIAVGIVFAIVAGVMNFGQLSTTVAQQESLKSFTEAPDGGQPTNTPAVQQEPLQPALQPPVQSQPSDDEQSRAHYAAIYRSHPDAATIAKSDDFSSWLHRQQNVKWLRIYENGTTGEVISMFDAYKYVQNTQRQRQSTPNPATKPHTTIYYDGSQQQYGGRTPSQQEMADLEATTKRMYERYPYLSTPEGQHVVAKINNRRDELIRKGTYPSLAMQQAVNALAAANDPSYQGEQRIEAIRPRTKQADCEWSGISTLECKKYTSHLD